jgi:NAD(P)H-hydrate repair Nnr-like enzyme with NAD(P)H-hydrate dehydratase domain
VVADASALDALPSGAVPPHGIRVVTPHAGEAGRLLGVSPLEVQSDRIGALERLSSRLGKAWVVLKGQGTLVGRSGELPWWNPTGNAGLAQGGSGDVLAGFLGASLAQPALAADVVRTLRGAVFRHGQAADRLEATREPWSAEDLARLVRW